MPTTSTTTTQIPDPSPAAAQTGLQGNPPPSVTPRTVTGRPVSRLGLVDSFRWRGPRSSSPILTFTECCIADITSTMRRLKDLAFRKPSMVLNLNQDQNENAVIQDFAPRMYQIAMIRLQSIRMQLQQI